MTNKLQDLRYHLRLGTNINNNTYTTNNTDNTNDTNNNDINVSSTGTIWRAEGTSGLGPFGGKPKEEDSVSARPKMPERWRGVKIDLFHNGINKDQQQQYKLAIHVQKQDNTFQTLIGNMNSPHHYLWRGVSGEERQEPHWLVVEQTIQQYAAGNCEYRCSKLLLPHKQNKTQIVAILSDLVSNWGVEIVYEARNYEFLLAKNSTLTAAQQAKNVIASSFFGRQRTAWANLADLGI